MADSINNVEDVILVRELPNKTSISGSDLYLSQTNTQSFKLSHSSLIASIPDNDTIKVDPTTNRLKVEGSILKQAYPVGSIYINAFDDRNPREILGFGIWSRIGEGKVLMGEGVGTDINQTSKSFPIGSSGGEYEHQLTEDEIPSHYHVQGFNTTSGVLGRYGNTSGLPNGNISDVQSAIGVQDTGANTSSVGGDQSHNNIQPYTTVYMWKREQDIDPDEPIGGTPVSNWVVDTNLFDDINNNHTSLVSSKAVKDYVDSNSQPQVPRYLDITSIEQYDQISGDEYSYDVATFGVGVDPSKVLGVYVVCYTRSTNGSRTERYIETNLGGGSNWTIIKSQYEYEDAGSSAMVFIPFSAGQTEFKLRMNSNGSTSSGKTQGWTIVGVSQLT